MNRKLARKVAKIHGVSVKEVRAESQAALDQAYTQPNFHARCVYSEGEKPTVDEFVNPTFLLEMWAFLFSAYILDIIKMCKQLHFFSETA